MSDIAGEHNSTITERLIPAHTMVIPFDVGIAGVTVYVYAIRIIPVYKKPKCADIIRNPICDTATDKPTFGRFIMYFRAVSILMLIFSF